MSVPGGRCGMRSVAPAVSAAVVLLAAGARAEEEVAGADVTREFVVTATAR